MSVRIYNKANREYIDNLLNEMEIDRNFLFEIEVYETKENGVIKNLTIHARQIKQCNLEEEN